MRGGAVYIENHKEYQDLEGGVMDGNSFKHCESMQGGAIFIMNLQKIEITSNNIFDLNIAIYKDL